MANCANLNIPIPQIPSIFLPSGTFNVSVSFGQVGVTCCKFTLPGFQLPLPIPLPAAALIPLITAMNIAIAAALPVLDEINIPTCPMDGQKL